MFRHITLHMKKNVIYCFLSLRIFFFHSRVNVTHSVKGEICSYHVKVGDDLIEDSKTLGALLIPRVLSIQLAIVGDGGKDDAHVLEGFMVEFVRSVLTV